MSDISDPLWRDLTQLRGELDRIDNALHDLLIERAEIVASVAALRAQGKVALRPGREAAIIRRLIARNRAPLAPQNLPRVWREILAGSLSQQTNFAIATAAPALAAIAREHFGALTPLIETPDAPAAFAAVRQGHATAALLPWPGPLDAAELDGLYVIARLPFWAARPRGTPPGEALVIAATPPDASGHDRTLIARGGEIIEIAGFLSPQDPLTADAIYLGAYAVPLPGENA